MKTTSKRTIKNIKNASIFVLGIIVTIIITKISDKIVPSEPVIVKEITDTIRILHNYELPIYPNDDSTRLELERKLKNLEILNNYDKKLKERINLITKNDGVVPNLILTNEKERFKGKGFIVGSSAPYFTSDCPDFNGKYLEIKIKFFNPDIVKDIAYLRVNIYMFDTTRSTESKIFVLEEFFEVKPEDNIIRLSNDFSQGKYEILYGFVFKDELTKTYPKFIFKRCVVIK